MEIEKERIHARIIEGLNNFKSAMLKVKNKEIDLNKPREVWKDDSLEFYEGTTTQHEIYDYKLIC